MGVQDRERMVLIHPRPYQRQWKDEHGAAIKAPDKPYWIDRHEVSAREMNRYGEAAGEATGGLGPNRGSPAVNITVYRARSYCRARGGDLPTLAQWRYATVGNSVRPYPWGVEAPGKERVVWHWPDRQEEGPAPVEQEVQRDVTPNGVWHLAGNIQEWTLQPVEGTKTNKGRVVGGSYRTLPSEVLKIQKWLGSLGAFVAENQPAKALHIGFRCAMKATL